MGFIASINRFIDLFIGTFKRFGLGRAWLLLLIWGAVNWLVLYAHYNFTSPVFYGIINTWTHLLGEQQATGFSHYPGHFMMLPYFFGWAKLIISVIFEGAVLGGVALLFYNSYYEPDEHDSSTFNQVLKSWIHLILAWVILNGLVLLFNILLPEFFESLILRHPRRRMFFDYGLMPFIYVILVALFFFTLPAIVIFGENVLAAIKRSFVIFFKNPFTCFFLALFILIIPIGVAKMLDNPGLMVARFKPELVYWVLLISLAADFLANFFWMGTAVRFLINEEE